MKFQKEQNVRIRFNSCIGQITGTHDVVGREPEYDVVYVTETDAVIQGRFPEYALLDAEPMTPPWGPLVPPPVPGDTGHVET